MKHVQIKKKKEFFLLLLSWQISHFFLSLSIVASRTTMMMMTHERLILVYKSPHTENNKHDFMFSKTNTHFCKLKSVKEFFKNIFISHNEEVVETQPRIIKTNKREIT